MAASYQEKAQTYTVQTYGKSRTVQAFSSVVMSRSLRCQVRVVWVYRKTQWVALFTTDLSLCVEEIIEFYAARWKIEAGFKELKQDIGSQCSQTRNPDAVTNHLNFCMMAMSLTWIYAAKLVETPQRRHKVNGRGSFAFSDVRSLIAKAAMSENFVQVCPVAQNPVRKWFTSVILSLAA